MSMRRLVCTLVLCAVAAGAFGADWYLVNETDAVLYVLADGEPLGDTGDLDPDATYRHIPAGGVLPVRPGHDQRGFAFTRDGFSFATFVVEASDLERAPVSESGRRYVAVTPGDLRRDRVVTAAGFADVLGRPRIDNEYLEWVRREPRIARARGRSPLGIFADFGEGREAISRDDSLLWTRGGTDLQWVKTWTDRQDLYLALAAYSEFARGTSVFFYFYDGTASVPVATIEIPAGLRTGLVLLWHPVKPQPVVAGNFVSSGLLLEAQIWLEVFTDAVDAEPGGLAVEVSTASSAAGVWEEFVLARTGYEALFGR